ncbi:hypothetical protein QBC43DRAFT_321866 [Cladorrhinum sp. PSN259]|nr:hypothetical protein QBC43DRAFT_321866 [Cladorrhinum sp. PSN259]
MDLDPSPTHSGRKRRAHKRSRKGCLTCKQRHIRCDELKPVCTNCLTRGGDCGYPAEPAGPPGPGIGVVEQQQQQRMTPFVPVPSSPADPFDSLPIKMPHKSLELFHHFTHFRIFTRTAVPKNPDSQCVGIAFSSPGTFRACLIMSALHYSWISGPQALQTGEMEETYLLHKLEAMRLVNEQLADPVLCTSDGCLSLIAALALAESGMGNPHAAQAHLNGLFTLLNLRRPEEWQHRFYGMLQRVILMAGSFIASISSSSSSSSPSTSSSHTTRVKNRLLSTAAAGLATRLSPFYLSTTPGMEACKADAEGEVLLNALSRLTAICYPNTRRNKEDIHAYDANATRTLLGDTEAYIDSLLFKPFAPSEKRLISSSPTVVKGRRKRDAYDDDATYRSSTSRAWATGAWLYLHFVLRSLREQYPEQVEKKVDAHLLRLLLDTLKGDVQGTEEEAVRAGGTYSVELWGWKVIVGAYVLQMLSQPDEDERNIGVYVEGELEGGVDERDIEMEGIVHEYQESLEGSDSSSDEENELAFPETEAEYIGNMKEWFNGKMSVWIYTAKLEDWQAARHMLRRIVWPNEDSSFEGDAVLEQMWWNARAGAYNMPESSEEGGYETQGSSSALVDPLLWGQI